jgi:hypothetical protein
LGAVTDSAPSTGTSRRRLALTVLAVGTDDWATEQAADSLRADGARVLQCHEPGEPAFPCNALIEGRTCPLDVGFDVVLTVRGRPLPRPSEGEMGVVCALRTGVPLVVAGMATHNPYSPWAASVVERHGDLSIACAEAATTVVLRGEETVDLRTEAPATVKGEA